MKRRRLLVVLILVLPTLAMLFLPPVHWRLIGWVRGEAFYKGRPTSFWTGRIREWSEALNGPPAIARMPDVFDRLKWAAGRQADPTQLPEVMQGDLAALPVLCELAEDSDPVIVRGSTLGLSEYGPENKRAQEVLERLLSHENESVRAFAKGALTLIRSRLEK